MFLLAFYTVDESFRLFLRRFEYHTVIELRCRKSQRKVLGHLDRIHRTDIDLVLFCELIGIVKCGIKNTLSEKESPILFAIYRLLPVEEK